MAARRPLNPARRPRPLPNSADTLSGMTKPNYLNDHDDDDELLRDHAYATIERQRTGPASRAAVERLEERIQGLEEVARHVTQPGGIADGEALLAKAAGAYLTSEGVLAMAEREINDATTMGIVSGYVAAGDLTAAQQVLMDTRDRSQLAKAADLAAEVGTMPGQDDSPVSAELLERFGRLERGIANVMRRLEVLESRPRRAPSAPVTPRERVLVKAPGTMSQPQTRGERAADLLRRIDAYVDSANMVGVLSSMVQQGKYDEVERAVQSAQQAHETEKVRQERQSWKQ